MSFGMVEGETCGRAGCVGVIAQHPSENCSCHISPPCGSCTTPREYCPECDWAAKYDAPELPDGNIYVWGVGSAFHESRKRAWDRSKIDYRIIPHSNSSQKVVGVFPPGTGSDAVRALVDGTFGGRFERWDEKAGEFTFIAYTD